MNEGKEGEYPHVFSALLPSPFSFIPFSHFPFDPRVYCRGSSQYRPWTLRTGALKPRGV